MELSLADINQKAVLSLHNDVPLLLGIPSTSLQKLFKQYPPKSFTLGRHVVITRSDLNLWVEAMKGATSCN